MPRLRRALIGALLTAALIAPTGAPGYWRAPSIKGAWSTYLPERVHGTSVAIGPDGLPWFGLSVLEPVLAIAHVSSGKPVVDVLREEGSEEEATGLDFDSQGALWFARNGPGPPAIVRREPNGALTEFDLPEGEPVTALTIGPAGDIWFVRAGYGEAAEAQVGRMTTAGVISQIPLEAGSRPSSITVGPDGAIWFSEELAGKIGRVATSGEVQLFPLAPKVHPRQIVAGPDGGLWFGENARARPYEKFSDRIGRITVDGRVSELPVPFGLGTSRLAADPRGVIWFTTDGGEFSSISPSGNVGTRGCVGRGCEAAIEGLALAPDGALWFAGAVPSCGNCGGGSGLILWGEGTQVGEIPAGALRPADPDGPPAKDPYAHTPTRVPAPIARTGRPIEVEESAARITGYVNPRGFPANWRFKWGRTKAYGHRSFLSERPFTSGEPGESVEEEIFGLCPRKTYHFELVAYGPGGRTSGGDRTFQTPSAEHPPEHCR
jgi:streptogramin lyase